MNERTPGAPGLLSSIRSLADGLTATVQDRLELVAVELQEEKFRLIQIFIWINVALFTGILAVGFLSLLLVVLFWDHSRVAVICSLAAVYAAACAAAVTFLKRLISGQPRLLDATRQEINEDRTCLQRDLQ